MADHHADFVPYIPPETKIREFTLRAVIVGTLLGMVFGASSLFLVLKVGMTVSASIPVAVISITLFRLWSKLGFKDATILEHNISQTAGSAGESLAFGVGVTMPAILILGFDLEISRVMLVAVLGGALGILMMIPLRRALIVAEHGQLKYPEGTACAEVLKAGASDESKAAAAEPYRKSLSLAGVSAKTIFAGFGIGILYKTLNIALKGWKDVPEKIFGGSFKAGSVSCEISPELLGVGYIIGPRIAGLMAGGGVLSYLVLIPLIKFFGESLAQPLAPAKTQLIRDMDPSDIRSAYILYIGAGAVAMGGIISLLRSAPMIWHGIRGGLADFSKKRLGGGGSALRTEHDLSMKFVLVGLVVLLAAITLAAPLHMNLLGALLIVVFGFLFVTVSSRLTGEIGSSSNPISGMTIATLLLTCLIFLLMGWTGNPFYVTALSVGAIVCIASSNGGTTSQDLKTGFLVGGTPKLQQIAILIGATASAVVLGPILLGLNQTATVYAPASKAGPEFSVKLPDAGVTKRERLQGPQAAGDSREYWVYHQPDPQGGDARKFLLDDAGKAVWLVDPGINGKVLERPDGSKVRKFDAPKATLVSYIIKGILDRKLPWALVIFGAMISLTLELCSVSSLAFAVGVYLPLSSSMPLFVGGLIRWLVDRHLVEKLQNTGLTREEIVAETDKSPGVLMSSGYIAGGSIAGILIAFKEGGLDALAEWATKHQLAWVADSVHWVLRQIDDWSLKNPFFPGTAAIPHPYADALSLIPFAVICLLLYLAAREKWLAART